MIFKDNNKYYRKLRPDNISIYKDVLYKNYYLFITDYYYLILLSTIYF